MTKKEQSALIKEHLIKIIKSPIVRTQALVMLYNGLYETNFTSLDNIPTEDYDYMIRQQRY